jgi:hypothetical protein
VNDGAGFTLNNPSRPALAWLINNDLPAAKRIIANDKTCMKMAGCRKGTN